jgi:hypothetical protein
VDRGLGSAHVQVDGSRTYILARLWPSGFSQEEAFACAEALGDNVEGEYLYIAAKWIRDRYTDADAQFRWATVVRDPSPDVDARVPAEMRTKLGMIYWLASISYTPLPHPPRWIAVHAEPSPARADAVMQELTKRVQFKPVVELCIVEQRLLRRQFAVGLERDLGDFDTTTPPKVDHSDRRTWPWHPLKLLHDEAKKLSVSSELVAFPTQSHGQVSGGSIIRGERTPNLEAPSPAEISPTDPDIAAKVQSLPPKERMALEGFLRACAADPELSSKHPTEAHHTYAVKHLGEKATFANWRKSASEGLRKVFGPARSRKPEATRSIIPINKLDIPGD